MVAGDRAQLFAWNDHPTVRSASFSSDPIDPYEHDRWFALLLDDPDRHAWIASVADGSSAIGLIRFAVDGPEAVVSVALDAEHQGRGWGAGLIMAGCAALAEVRPRVERVVALIKPDNGRSASSFRAAGFDPIGALDATADRYVYPMGARS